MQDLLPILRELCEAFGPPGFEEEVRAVVRRYAEPLADEIAETPLGNLIATRRGQDAKKTLLLDAHTDEVGLMVTHVEESGFLRFAPLGGIDPRVVPAQRVAVRAADGTKHTGVVGVLPPHVTDKKDYAAAFDFPDLCIDLGCPSAVAVEALGITVGSPAVFDVPFAEIAGGCVAAKALDDRAGCSVALGVLRAYENDPPPVNLVVTFTVQEETGGLGAATATFETRPDFALALEGTTATDTPGVPPQKVACALRRGPAVTLADAGTIVPRRIVEYIEGQAREAHIPWQRKTPRIGGTNARLIQQTRSGVPAGIIAVPCRYIHSSASVLFAEDLQNTLALAIECVAGAPRLWEA